MSQKEWARQVNQSIAIAQAMVVVGQRLFGPGTELTAEDHKLLEKLNKRKRKTRVP